MSKGEYTKVGPRSKATSVREPLPGQVPNSDGGWVYGLDPFQRLRRFLILGSDAPTYYATARALTKENAAAVKTCVETDRERTINEIVAVSKAGNAPKNDPALFALAICAAAPNATTRRLALEALPSVARTASHLFAFMAYVDTFRGKSGQLMKRAISAWYNKRSVSDLAYQMVKYRERSGWTHKDLLATVHVKPVDDAHNHLYAWAMGKIAVDLAEEPSGDDDYAQVWAFERTKNEHDKAVMLAMIEKYRLTHEMVPTWFKKDADIWEALLVNMPMEAMLRNLVNMGETGLLKPMSASAKLVADRLGDQERVARSRLHPLKILVAAKMYAGSSVLHVPQIRDALDAAFYLAFGNVPTTGKNILLALDVSSSMDMGNVAGLRNITPREAVAAMALVTMRREPNYYCAGFSHQFVELPISPAMSLTEVAAAMQRVPYGATDMSLPYAFAKQRGMPVDAFITYTDNEVNRGNHPQVKLAEYRRATSKQARSVIVGTTATDFSIADPLDPLSLDVCGFDTAAPELIGAFIGGEF